MSRHSNPADALVELAAHASTLKEGAPIAVFACLLTLDDEGNAIIKAIFGSNMTGLSRIGAVTLLQDTLAERIADDEDANTETVSAI